VLGLAARPDGADDRTLADDVALGDRRRAEVDKRHRMTAWRFDRHHFAVRADGPCERDDSRSRRKDLLFAFACHVDPPVLAAGVRVAAVDERFEDVPRGRPRPRGSGGRGRKRKQDKGDYEHASHLALTSLADRTTV
jgi:hypothetical protein